MKKIFLCITLLSHSILALSHATIDSFMGRWYEKVLNSSGDFVHQLYTGTKTINIEVSNSVANIYSGAMNHIADAASEWTNATGHLFLNPTSSGINFNFTWIINNKNEISFDDSGIAIDPTSSKRLGFCNVTRDWTKDNVFGGGTNRRFAIYEADVALHKHDPMTFKWTLLSTSNINSSCYEYDLESVILHELGHVIGLGHAKGAAANVMVMAEAMYACNKNSTLTSFDINAAHDLYDPGPSLTGILPNTDFKKGTTGLPCRLANEIWEEAINGNAQAAKLGCKDKCQNGQTTCHIYSDGNGFSIGCNPPKRSLNNNLGLSDLSVVNINNYINVNNTFNYKRFVRMTSAFIENNEEIHKSLDGFIEYTSGNILSSEYLSYKNLYIALDNLIDELIPLIDATFRCETNLLGMDLTLKQKHITLIDNVLNEITALQPYSSLSGEVNYLKSLEPALLGLNVKEGYSLLLNSSDPAL